MSEERIQNITSPQPEEQEIDLIELAQKKPPNPTVTDDYSLCQHLRVVFHLDINY